MHGYGFRISTSELASLPAAAVVPGDADYDSARRVWNGTIDRHPLAVVPCASLDDVIVCVRAAAERGVPLAVRGGGHSVPGFSTCDGGIVIDLSPLNAVEVDAEARVALVGGGATWAIVDAATERHGLATTGGVVSTTGVGGLTLGGGIGWLTRKCGLACDGLLSADVVTAAGDVVRAGLDGDPELLWGLRGGGGNFGVVTRFEFRLHPVRQITGGLSLFAIERAREVFTFYREWVGRITDDLTPMLIFLEGPDADFVPEHLRGTSVIAIGVCHAGDKEAAEAELAPLQSLQPDLYAIERMPYTALQSMFDADVPPGDRYYFKGGFGAGYPDAMLDVLVEHLERRPGSRCEVDLHHMGGAAGRVGDMDTAYPGRAAVVTSNVYGCWTDPAQDGAHREWARGLADALMPFGTRGAYVNFMSEADADSPGRAYGEERMARLRALKRRYDPDNLLRLNQNIKP